MQMREKIEAADANMDSLETVEKRLAEATDRLDRTNVALAKAEHDLKEKSWTISKARAESIAAHDAEIAKRQDEIRRLTAEVAALNKALTGAKD
jgi:DNA anti-recombination protein RmuC